MRNIFLNIIIYIVSVLSVNICFCQVNFRLLYPEVIPEKINKINYKQNLIAGAGNYGNFIISSDNGISFLQKKINTTEDLVYITNSNSFNFYSSSDKKIFYTSNTGLNWNLIRQDESGINSLFLSFTGNLFYSNNSSIYKSTNKGEYWYNVTPYSNYSYSMIESNNKNTIYLNARDNITTYTSIIKSSDDGTTWTKFDTNIDNLLIKKIYFLNENYAIALADRYEQVMLLKTMDGNTWNEIIFSFYYPQKSKDIKMFTQNTFIIASDKTVYKTTNGGINWTILLSNQIFSNAIIQSEDSLIITDYSGRIIRCGYNENTKDTLLGKNYNTLSDIIKINSQIFIASGYNHTILKTTNGGTSWFDEYNSSTVGLEKIIYVNSSIGYATAQRYKVMKTTNQGLNWSVIFERQTPMIDIHFLDELIGWCISEESIYKTNDGGLTWSMPMVNGGFSNFKFLNSNTGFAINNGLYKTTNAGLNWQLVKPEIVSFDFINVNMGWTVSNSDTNSFVFYTSNSGINWINKGNFVGNTNLIKAYNENILYILSYHKIFRSSNSGINWSSYTFPLSENLSVLDFEITGADTLFLCGNSGIIAKIDNASSIFVKDDKTIANHFSLKNYPNPFNQETIISYTLPKRGFIKLVIYDISGREISTLVNSIKTAGEHIIYYKPHNISSGIYFYQLIQDNATISTKKMVFLK